MKQGDYIIWKKINTDLREYNGSSKDQKLLLFHVFAM